MGRNVCDCYSFAICVQLRLIKCVGPSPSTQVVHLHASRPCVPPLLLTQGAHLAILPLVSALCASVEHRAHMAR